MAFIDEQDEIEDFIVELVREILHLLCDFIGECHRCFLLKWAIS